MYVTVVVGMENSTAESVEGSNKGAEVSRAKPHRCWFATYCSCPSTGNELMRKTMGKRYPLESVGKVGVRMSGTWVIRTSEPPKPNTVFGTELMAMVATLPTIS